MSSAIKEMLTAALKWMEGGVHALEFAKVLHDPLLIATALERGASCFGKAAVLMKKAAKKLREQRPE